MKTMIKTESVIRIVEKFPHPFVKAYCNQIHQIGISGFIEVDKLKDIIGGFLTKEVLKETERSYGSY